MQSLKERGQASKREKSQKDQSRQHGEHDRSLKKRGSSSSSEERAAVDSVLSTRYFLPLACWYMHTRNGQTEKRLLTETEGRAAVESVVRAECLRRLFAHVCSNVSVCIWMCVRMCPCVHGYLCMAGMCVHGCDGSSEVPLFLKRLLWARSETILVLILWCIQCRCSCE